MEIKVKIRNWRKITRGETSVPVQTIQEEELWRIYEKGCGMTWWLTYQNMIMLSLDCDKIGEKLSLMRKIRKPDRKLYFRKKF